MLGSPPDQSGTCDLTLLLLKLGRLFSGGTPSLSEGCLLRGDRSDSVMQSSPPCWGDLQGGSSFSEGSPTSLVSHAGIGADPLRGVGLIRLGLRAGLRTDGGSVGFSNGVRSGVLPVLLGALRLRSGRSAKALLTAFEACFEGLDRGEGAASASLLPSLVKSASGCAHCPSGSAPQCPAKDLSLRKGPRD